jgi:hypothetical protein
LLLLCGEGEVELELEFEGRSSRAYVAAASWICGRETENADGMAVTEPAKLSHCRVVSS